MLARAEAEASKRGYRRISLGTRALYVEAVRLYERAGGRAAPTSRRRARTGSTTATSSVVSARGNGASALWL